MSRGEGDWWIRILAALGQPATTCSSACMLINRIITTDSPSRSHWSMHPDKHELEPLDADKPGPPTDTHL
jgi:hypothetical protein